MSQSTWTEEDSRKAIQNAQEKQKADFLELRNSLEVDGEILTSKRKTIVNLPFSDLQNQLQKGNLSAIEVLEAYQAKALLSTEKYCNVTGFIPNAKIWAKEKDELPPSERKPLHGIPVSIKEIVNIQGLDSTNALAKNLFKPKEDHAIIVKILLEQGAIPFCKTNIPITCKSYSSMNMIFGKTLNPHSETRSPGGSSGGEASLIADGGSILGVGTDFAGSIRYPSNACGIYGIKPTDTRLSRMGLASSMTVSVGSKPAIGFMGRDSHAISAAMKAVLSSNSMFDLDTGLVPLNWKSEISLKKPTLRIGFHFGDDKFPIVPGCVRAIELAKKHLENSGQELIPVNLPDMSSLPDVLVKLITTEAGSQYANLLDGEMINDPFVILLRFLSTQNNAMSSHDYMELLRELQLYIQEVQKMWT